MTPRQIAEDYFAARPAARDEVTKAYHARIVVHRTDHPGAHWFAGFSPGSVCRWCGRTRDLVRYDGLPAECASRPDDLPEVASVLMDEESRAFALYDRARAIVPAMIARHGMSGETLAMLHGTHGIDPETVDSICPVPAGMIAGYEAEREKDRARSRAAHKPEVIRMAGAP